MYKLYIMTLITKDKPNQIYLSISQIAILIGHSPYGSLIEMILNLWSKVDKNRYNKKILELEHKFSKSFKSISDWDKLTLLSNQLGLNNLKSKINLPIDWWLNESSRDNNFKVYWAEPTIVTQGTQNGLFQTSL